ncbi:MAG TPA: YidB family protein [Dehalococcoidia bacterium]
MPQITTELTTGLGGGWMTNIIGKVFGGGGGDSSALLKGLGDTMGSSGGVSGLLDKFDAAGLGDKARSWVGDGGDKQPVSGDEVRQAWATNNSTRLHGRPECRRTKRRTSWHPSSRTP